MYFSAVPSQVFSDEHGRRMLDTVIKAHELYMKTLASGNIGAVPIVYGNDLPHEAIHVFFSTQDGKELAVMYIVSYSSKRCAFMGPMYAEASNQLLDSARRLWQANMSVLDAIERFASQQKDDGQCVNDSHAQLQ